MSFLEGIADVLGTLESEGRLRKLPENFCDYHKDFSGNDYMGLGYASTLSGETSSGKMTSSASRLLASSQNEYSRLESLLGNLYGRESLLFNSGYHANTGIVQALGSLPSTLIIADKLVHASIIDGIRLSGADFVRFRHNDMSHLRNILNKKRNDYRRVMVVAEGIYSMDGDKAPVAELVDIRREYDTLLYIDEAHSFGVSGKKGLGVSEESGILEEVDVIVGTFGKATASYGAFAAVSPEIKSYLINTARSFIFSTSLPESVISWTIKMVERLQTMQTEREHLARLSDYFRKGIERITGEENLSRSQIIPLMVGDPVKAVEISERLRREGYRALAIRRPTVPAGTERIRFSIGAHHTEEDIDSLLSTLERLV